MMSFASVNVEAPVSDGKVSKGVQVFIQGLRDLGYAPELLLEKSDHVIFYYTVPGGSHAHEKVRLGFIVPADFPVTIPSGFYVSPPLTLRSPESMVHASGTFSRIDDMEFSWSSGGKWQYRAQTFPNWDKTRKDVEAYMGCIARLWDEQ
jgi:hypothetical protein